MLTPGSEEIVPHLLVEVASVGHEGGGEETVADDGRHLGGERLRSGFPSLSLRSQRLEQSDGSVHLLLDLPQRRLDRLSLNGGIWLGEMVIEIGNYHS